MIEEKREDLHGERGGFSWLYGGGASFVSIFNVKFFSFSVL